MKLDAQVAYDEGRYSGQNPGNPNQRRPPVNISASTDVMSATISQPQSGSRPPPSPGGGETGGPPDHASAIENMGSTLTDDIRDSVLVGVKELEKSGTSFEEIKPFADSEPEANSVDVSSGQQQPGQLVNIRS